MEAEKDNNNFEICCRVNIVGFPKASGFGSGKRTLLRGKIEHCSYWFRQGAFVSRLCLIMTTAGGKKVPKLASFKFAKLVACSGPQFIKL